MTNILRVGLIGLLALGTAACTDGYGYSGVSLGYGSAGYYDDPYNGGYGGGYYGAGYGAWGSPYYGWYDDFYYPGTGVYVYDRGRRAVRWSDRQRDYWMGRRQNWRGGEYRDNWQGFRRDVRKEQRDYRGDLRANRDGYRAGTIDRGAFLEGRRDARREFRQDVRQDYRDYRRENRQAWPAGEPRRASIDVISRRKGRWRRVARTTSGRAQSAALIWRDMRNSEVRVAAGQRAASGERRPRSWARRAGVSSRAR